MNTLLQPVKKLIHFCNGICVRASTVLLAAMLFIVTLNVILRYIFHYSISWTEESARFMMVWITFMLFPYAQEKGTQIVVDFLVIKWRYTRTGVALAIFIETLTVLVLAVCLWQGFGFVARATTTTMALQIPMRWVVVVMPYSFLMTLLSSLCWLLTLLPLLADPLKLKDLDLARTNATGAEAA